MPRAPPFGHPTQRAIWARSPALHFSAGVFGVVWYAILESLYQSGISGVYKTAHAFLHDWSWPKAHGWDAAIKDVLAPERVKASREAKRLKCSAGESLSLYPVLFNFVVRMDFGSEYPLLLAVALSFTTMTDLVMEVSQGTVSKEQLRTAVRRFLEAFVAAGFIEYMVSKFHWLVHFPITLERLECSVMCFALERKHKEAKRYAADHCNMTSYGRSLMLDAVMHNLVKAGGDDFNFARRLLAPRRPTKRVFAFMHHVFEFNGGEVAPNDVSVALSAVYGRRGKFHVDDVVLVRDGPSYTAVQVRLIASIHGEEFFVASPWTLESRDPRLNSWSRWKRHSNFTAFSLEDVVAPCTHKAYSDGHAVVLHPYHVR